MDGHPFYFFVYVKICIRTGNSLKQKEMLKLETPEKCFDGPAAKTIMVDSTSCLDTSEKEVLLMQILRMKDLVSSFK